MNQNVTNTFRKGWSIADIAGEYGLSRAFVRKQIKLGLLVAARLGRRVVIPSESVTAWLQSGMKSNNETKE